MDIVDLDLEKAESGASPNQFPARRESKAEYDLHRSETVGSHSTASSTSSASIVREEMGISRVNTQRDLERHPTHLSRIETERTQHSATVGRSTTSRSSRKPLPSFGAGKSYPPALPDRDEYVVEFDGPHDPLHPQNWTMKKK